MSQSIHFARLKYFSEEFTKTREYQEILQELKSLLKEEDKKIDEIIDNKFVDNIETRFITLSANTPAIEKFLKTNSKVQLHQDSKYYFVTEDLWNALKTEFSEFLETGLSRMRKDRNTDKFDLSDFARDFVEIEDQYHKKMLLIEAS